MKQGIPDLGSIAAAELRLRPYLNESPFRRCGDERGPELWVKEEHLLPTGSFKIRGALNALLMLGETARAPGVVTASSGNHGAAVAHSAALLGVRARVYVPEGASPVKVAKIQSKGADVVHYGIDGLETELEARRVAQMDGVTYVSPYNDPAIMAGQGTAAVELLRQGPTPDRIYVATGGGGLIGGMAIWLAAHAPAARIVGVLPEHSPVMAASVQAGRIVEMESLPTLSDGTAGGIEPGSITFPVCRDLVHEWVTVSEDEIAGAMRWWGRHEPAMIEGSAGVALAAFLRDAPQLNGERCAVVICGGNITPERWQGVLAG